MDVINPNPFPINPPDLKADPLPRSNNTNTTSTQNTGTNTTPVHGSGCTCPFCSGKDAARELNNNAPQGLTQESTVLNKTSETVTNIEQNFKETASAEKTTNESATTATISTGNKEVSAKELTSIISSFEPLDTSSTEIKSHVTEPSNTNTEQSTNDASNSTKQLSENVPGKETGGIAEQSDHAPLQKGTDSVESKPQNIEQKQSTGKESQLSNTKNDSHPVKENTQTTTQSQNTNQSELPKNDSIIQESIKPNSLMEPSSKTDLPQLDQSPISSEAPAKETVQTESNVVSTRPSQEASNSTVNTSLTTQETATETTVLSANDSSLAKADIDKGIQTETKANSTIQSDKGSEEIGAKTQSSISGVESNASTSKTETVLSLDKSTISEAEFSNVSLVQTSSEGLPVAAGVISSAANNVISIGTFANTLTAQIQNLPIPDASKAGLASLISNNQGAITTNISENFTTILQTLSKMEGGNLILSDPSKMAALNLLLSNTNNVDVDISKLLELIGPFTKQATGNDEEDKKLKKDRRDALNRMIQFLDTYVSVGHAIWTEKMNLEKEAVRQHA